ncbi:PH domain-containing protein [Georgenia satyanarayanai]|uniref:PH domain-containing protein n=1 Tax=Georgenia satyanarayanai TaxID=860221 RepID=UPI00186AD8B6|nr:PH domain-containing protein [Georgenia satyanarayanai]
MQRTGLLVLLPLVVWTLTFDDVDGVMRVAQALLVAVTVAQVVNGRAGTVADDDGIEVCGGVRTRRVPWTTVEEVRAVWSQWEDPKVEIRLTDGSVRTLPCVSTDDVPQLEELQARARE